MFRLCGIFCAAFLINLLSSVAPAAESLKADHIEVSWIAPADLSASGDTIGLRFKIDPHWHIYWKNPGDSGTAPKFKLQSEQADLSRPAWPVPKRFMLGGLTTIGYENEVTFPVSISPKTKDGTIRVTAALEWLVCQEECLPGSGELTLERKVTASPPSSPEREAITEALALVPRPQNRSPYSIRHIETSAEDLVLSIKGKDQAPLERLTIFPVDAEAFSPVEPAHSADGNSLHLKLQPGQAAPDRFDLVLADEKGAWEFPGVSTQTQDKTTSASAYIILLLSAFVGGLILNLMPCVLPVLSIKFFSLAKVDKHTRWTEALLYTLGVLVTFAALGGLFLALRAGGTAIGWGFQLQSPPIVTALIILFWMMGLSFLGFFEFGDSVTRVAGRFENVGAFGTGCLSVFVATPCTGPFMGTALGAAAVLPAAQALIIFLFLGLGLASPFLALALFPKIKLPKPGMWMVTLRQALAFPLFGTVIWLLWVLGSQLGNDSWVYLSSVGLLLVFFVWLGKGRPNAFKAAAILGSIAAIAAVEHWAITTPLAKASTHESADTVWINYDPKIIEEAKAQHQAVFVDFTAAWCVTCQVNKKAVLETDLAEELFKKNNVKLVKADWTNLDETITQALAAFNRASVPLYLFYPADGSAPKILPQILSRSDIEGLFIH